MYVYQQSIQMYMYGQMMTNKTIINITASHIHWVDHSHLQLCMSSAALQ